MLELFKELYFSQEIENNNEVKVFKLKTTKPILLKPSKAFNSLQVAIMLLFIEQQEVVHRRADDLERTQRQNKATDKDQHLFKSTQVQRVV